MNKRAVILSTAIVFGFALVILRLADVMLMNHDRLSERAREQYSVKKDLHASRGKMYDRGGRELAVNVDMLSAYCNPRELESPGKAASALASITGTSLRKLLGKVSSDRGFVWIKRKLDRDSTRRLKSLSLKGVGFLPEVKRYYPNGSLAAHVIGFVGIDNQALEGIELKYDGKLKGRQESVRVVRDAGGRMLSDGRDYQRGGNSMVLTIDEGLVEQWQPVSATAIMMNPYTGDVLAMANRPTYDPNDPSASEVSARRNRALTDSFEPGSTFKIIAASGVFEEGLVKNATKFDCSDGFIKVGRRAIWDTHNNGVLSFREVIQTSSNVGTVMLGMMLEKQKMYEYVRRFGFGEKTGIDLPGESPGIVRPLDKWSDTALASASIGYGVAVTPLQILRAYSAIANGGVLVQPHVVSEIISPEGGTVYRFRPDGQKRAISRRTAETIRDILVLVTQKGGTATRASVEGNTGKYSTERYSSSFVGFAPADRPKIALMVVLFEPKGKYYGGRVAAPVFQEIMDQSLSYLNVPREDDFNRNLLVVKAKDL
jgi:cell division protein FtsI (penicillin-binding protein 3)